MTVRGHETAAGAEEVAQGEELQEEQAWGAGKETDWLHQLEEKLHAGEECLRAEQEHDCLVDNEFARAWRELCGRSSPGRNIHTPCFFLNALLSVFEYCILQYM